MWPNHFCPLSLIVYIKSSAQVNDLLGVKETLPPPWVSHPDGLLRGGVNTTPLRGSLPRRSQRPGEKTSLSQRS